MDRNATEAEAEAAIAALRRAIDAAENSNQAGENAVVCMAAGPRLLAALEEIAALDVNGPLEGPLTYEDAEAAIGIARAAIAKARN